jgi:predicted DNA-binding transcriptional regulator YafY
VPDNLVTLKHRRTAFVYRRGDLSHLAHLRARRLRGFRRGRRLSEIAAELHVSERTVRRDLGDLRAAGFGIERRDRRPRLAPRRQVVSTISITRRERYTLRAVGSMFEVLRGTPLWEDVASLGTKLAQRMSPEEREEHATFGERFAYIPDGGTKAYAGKEDILDALLTGVLSRRVVRFGYRGATGRIRHGFLAPYTMAIYKHGLYVIGSELGAPADGKAIADGTQIRVYAVERFTDAEHLRKAPFVPPADFRVAKFFDGAFGIHAGASEPPAEVVVEFSAARAAFVRARIWHPTQIVDELPGGGVRLSFTCANLVPVVSWVLEWGPHARAMAPPSLVANVVAEIEGARAQYP